MSAGPAEEAPDLDAEDEALLDSIWDRLDDLPDAEDDIDDA